MQFRFMQEVSNSINEGLDDHSLREVIQEAREIQFQAYLKRRELMEKERKTTPPVEEKFK